MHPAADTLGLDGVTGRFLFLLLCVGCIGRAGMVDVKNKRCEAAGCMKRGLFGFDGEKARFCGAHRFEGERACWAAGPLTKAAPPRPQHPTRTRVVERWAPRRLTRRGLALRSLRWPWSLAPRVRHERRRRYLPCMVDSMLVMIMPSIVAAIEWPTHS